MTAQFVLSAIFATCTDIGPGIGKREQPKQLLQQLMSTITKICDNSSLDFVFLLNCFDIVPITGVYFFQSFLFRVVAFLYNLHHVYLRKPKILTALSG